MRVVGEKGVLEMDMFGQEIQVYSNSNMRHSVAGFKSNDDHAMVTEFVNAVRDRRTPAVTGEDGVAAAKVALAAYASLD
jgi:predicted dehydrogenase